MPRIFTKKSQQEKRRRLRVEMTKAEVLLWLELKDRKILGERFLRQYSMTYFVVDFYCPRLKLAIEIDGPTHLPEEQIEYDSLRQSEIEKLKIQFLRFTNEHVYDDMTHVLESIRGKVMELRTRKK